MKERLTTSEACKIEDLTKLQKEEGVPEDQLHQLHPGACQKSQIPDPSKSY